MSDSSSIDDDEACCSTGSTFQSQIGWLEKTQVIADDFTLLDVLEKFKDQVRAIATRLTQLDQHLSLNKSPADPSTHQELFKVKRNIISGITSLLKETKPLNYPSFQSLSSVKLLKVYEKVSEECKLLLNNIKQDNENIIKNIDRFKNLSIYIKDFQQEIDKIIAQNTVSVELENEVSREFKECKSDLYSILSQVDPSSTSKEVLSLLVECDDENSEDSWLNVEELPHLVSQCYKLKKNGFVLQHEENKHLFKLNI